MVTKTVFSTTRKGNVIVFDLKFSFEKVVQPYANYRTRVYWVQMSVIIYQNELEVKDTTDAKKSASDFVIHLAIDSRGKLKT